MRGVICAAQSAHIARFRNWRPWCYLVAVERQKEDVLAQWTTEFDEAVPLGAQLRDRLKRAGWEITYTRPSPQRKSWLLYLQPAAKLRNRFDLAPEVLAVVAPFDKAQASEVDVAMDALRQTHRLDRGLVLFFSGDKQARKELSPVLPAELAFIFFLIDEFLEASDPERQTHKILAEHLASGRPFAPGSPVSDAQFFGRQTELSALERRLLETAYPVGLFGLRKIGKTSLAYRLRAKWRQDKNSSGPRAILIYCDLQSIPFSRRNRMGLMRKVVEEIRITIDDINLKKTFADRPWNYLELRKIDAQTIESLAIDALDELLEWAKSSATGKIVFAIDEYERLLNGEVFTPRDGLDILDLLRGYTQQHPELFSFMVIGLDRRWALQARFDRRQNPLFGALFQMPLGGLSRQELGTLVRKLGRRVGLDFNHESIDRIFLESGGHPYIARLLADLLDREQSHDRITSIQVGLSQLLQTLPLFDLESATTMQEIADSVMDLARSSGNSASEAAHFWLCHTDCPAPSEIAGDLIQYGIIDSVTRLTTIGAFARWARKNYAQGEHHGG